MQQSDLQDCYGERARSICFVGDYYTSEESLLVDTVVMSIDGDGEDERG